MEKVKIPRWMAEKIRDYCDNSYSCDFCIFGGECRDYNECPKYWALDAMSVEGERWHFEKLN